MRRRERKRVGGFLRGVVVIRDCLCPLLLVSSQDARVGSRERKDLRLEVGVWRRGGDIERGSGGKMGL